MIELYRKSNLRIKNTRLDFVRYLLNDIEWEDRLIGIKGARGTGKTTIMLQFLKEKLTHSQKGLYVSLDDLYFSKSTLSAVAEEFRLSGGTHLFIDEVHKYPNWSIEVKTLYDTYPDLNIVFSGSSALQLQKAEADLSRRAAIYNLHELSFREYLEFSQKRKIEPLALEDLLQNHVKIASELTTDFNPIPELKKYLEEGVYPFFKEVKGQYTDRLQSVVNTILESDLPQIENITYSTVYKLKKLLLLIADSKPFKINTAELSRETGMSRDLVLNMINVLDRANLIMSIHQKGGPKGHLSKPDKIYLNNTALFYALHTQDLPSVGTARETFFANQLIANHRVESAAKGDFLIDGKYTFEIGGKSKNDAQIKGVNNACLALDMIEIGYNNSIPLWLFGLMY